MSVPEPDFAPALKTALLRVFDDAESMSSLVRLSGGASQETWAIGLALKTGEVRRLVMRRAPGGGAAPRAGVGTAAAGLETEARVIARVWEAGVPVPPVPYVFVPEDGVGSAYLMEFVAGETIARKILRDAEFDAVRPRLAHQCGEILARIHACGADAVDGLRVSTARDQLRQYEDTYRGYDFPHPVFDYAFKWLDTRLSATDAPTLVHGDFRNGNLMIAPDGVRAVLDWELTHVGDPLEDLSWICVNSWRFGVSNKVVGGFGDVADLLAGYAEGGGRAYSVEDVRTWEVFGTLKWGVMCMGMYQAFATGYDRSVERAAIGRRSSETEIDLVNLLISGTKRP